jgi:hypothetical protein
MPKRFLVEITVPSGSQAPSFHRWLDAMLAPHRMEVMSVDIPHSDPVEQESRCEKSPQGFHHYSSQGMPAGAQACLHCDKVQER